MLSSLVKSDVNNLTESIGKNFDSIRHKLYIDFLKRLSIQDYQFTTVTPKTHEHFFSQKYTAYTLQDIFGWNLPFAKEILPPDLFILLNQMDSLERQDALFKSKVRVSSIGKDLFLHSSFPTVATDAVFFGPDTYRFARFIRQELQNKLDFLGEEKPFRILDIGCGSGAGGIVAARQLSHIHNIELTMNDINPKALEFALINAAFANIPIQLALGNGLSVAQGKFDLIISNPPYLDDRYARAYRHGGSQFGRDLSVEITKQSITRLNSGGRLLLYTGVAMVDNFDPFLKDILPSLDASLYEWNYEEIDPDIFGEELLQPNYLRAHRIAAVGLMVKRK